MAAQPAAGRAVGAHLVSWRITIEHSSTYRYAGHVTSSYNEARITPLSFARQLVIDS
jgi:hypothetical protein